MYKISTDPLFGTIKVSGCGFLSVPLFFFLKLQSNELKLPKKRKKKNQRCALHLKRKTMKKLTVGGPCADTKKKNFPKEPGNQSGNRSTYFTHLEKASHSAFIFL